MLTGCKKSPDVEEVKVGEPEDVISLSISYSDMSRTSAYSYTLEEKNGEVLFSCQYFNEDYDEINIEEAPVDFAFMTGLRDIVKKHGLQNYRYREPAGMDLGVRDAPVYSLAMRWPKGEGGAYSNALRLNYFPEGTEELIQFFRSLGAVQE